MHIHINQAHCMLHMQSDTGIKALFADISERVAYGVQAYQPESSWIYENNIHAATIMSRNERLNFQLPRSHAPRF